MKIDYLLRKARAYNVPGTRSFLAADTPQDIASQFPQESNAGPPILVFVRDGANWSFLGHDGMGGKSGGVYSEVRYEDVINNTGFFDDESAPKDKRRLKTLRVTTQNGCSSFEAAPGEDLFALWNLFRKFQSHWKRTRAREQSVEQPDR